uniref:Catalase core domain-containing protein n=1 Tax=Heliothis virescens TaxID=7102 RepID=A0A2A4JNL0_HELVI
MKTEWCFLLFCVLIQAGDGDDPAGNQVVDFRDRTPGPIGIMTTSLGAPINHRQASGTLNKRLIFHDFFMDQVLRLNRERIPPRVVHAKGGGAFGYFEVTHDMRDICKAKLFNNVGKKTPIAVRFSLVLQEVGGIDTSRDVRGFSVKFYTEDGNFDIVGLNTPVFIIKDPLFFPTFARSGKRNPQTFLYDSNMLWDFLVLRPETMHNQVRIFSDLGIPDGYRHMPGFGVHTFQLVNEENEKYFIRFHFTPDAGVKNLKSSEAQKIAGYDPDYANRDLFNAIGTGHFPSWTVSIQVLSVSDVKNADFDVFDVTRVLPEDKYPLRPVGKLVLNKNPVNYFAEIEQLAFCPGNLVPGILGSPDKQFEARRLSYRDAQNYRLGGNFKNIGVNKAIREPLTYNRDGEPPIGENERNVPNYYPNSYNGPVPYFEENEVDLIEIYESPAVNLDQTREFYEHMTIDEKARLIENILYSLGSVTDPLLKERSVKLLRAINPQLGNRVLEGLIANRTEYFWNKEFK